MYYLVDNDPDQKYYDVSDLLDACISNSYWEDDTDGFDEYLDDGNGIEICGYDFNASEVLREMNYDAYCSELRYWAENCADNEREECQYALERATNGEQVYICDHRVFCYDDEEDEESEDTDGDETAFELLEKKIAQEKEAEAREAEKDNAIVNDFLSVIGIQVI